MDTICSSTRLASPRSIARDARMPVVADFDDRFVIRRYSPSHTIGGGRILQPRDRKAKRRQAGVLERLSAYREGRFADALEAALLDADLEPVPQADLERLVPFAARTGALADLERRGVLERLEGGFVHRRALEAVGDRIADLEALRSMR